MAGEAWSAREGRELEGGCYVSVAAAQQQQLTWLSWKTCKGERLMIVLLFLGFGWSCVKDLSSTLSILFTLQGHVKILEMLLATADAEMEERVQPAGPPELQKIGNQLKEIGEGQEEGGEDGGRMWGGRAGRTGKCSLQVPLSCRR